MDDFGRDRRFGVVWLEKACGLVVEEGFLKCRMKHRRKTIEFNYSRAVEWCSCAIQSPSGVNSLNCRLLKRQLKLNGFVAIRSSAISVNVERIGNNPFICTIPAS